MKMLNTEFKKNFSFQDGYLQQIQSIVSLNLQHMVTFRKGTQIEDSYQSTDMVINIDMGVAIAVRIRRPDCKYRDLTIRSRSWGNGKTEIDKLRDGWGDWYLYAWQNKQNVLDEWMLINIHAMRSSGLLGSKKVSRFNTDGKTAFISYSIDELFKSGSLVSAHFLRQERYWHHIVDMKAGRIWNPDAYSILKPASA